MPYSSPLSPYETMSEARPGTRHMSRNEYLRSEETATVKHEWYRGEIFAMAGATRDHVVLAGNVASALRESDCLVLQSDMRVWIESAQLYTYPDVVAVCGEEAYESESQTTLLTPTLVVEVTSPSTEAYDRGRKFDFYRTIDSVEEVVIVAHDRRSIDLFRREGSRWVLDDSTGGEVELTSAGVRLDLDRVYRNVDVDASPPTL